MDDFEHTVAWLGSAEADQLLAVLIAELPWERKQITLFGKTHPIPRLTCWLGEASYTYSSVVNEPIPFTAELAALKDRLSRECQAPFNSVLANLYRDGNDTMGWHRDNEAELGAEPVIASVNVGATRDFVVRHRATGERTVFALSHGDLMVMSGGSQIEWEHCVPARRRIGEARINLTFRQIHPPAATPGSQSRLVATGRDSAIVSTGRSDAAADAHHSQDRQQPGK